jgi:sugar phosphate isomerase/epimerase
MTPCDPNQRPPGSYPMLEKSYKGSFPFRLGTTSFIYPESWVPNVKRLGNFVDEIELLVMESDPACWPTRHDILELSHLAAALQLTFNIHLPLDVFLGHEDRSIGNQAVSTLLRCLERVAPLPVSVHVLHADLSANAADARRRGKWIERVHASLSRLTAGNMAPHKIAVETLNYPLTWLDPVIADLGLSVCLDLGHLWLNGLDPLELFTHFQDRTAILHLHGVKGAQDHVALNHLSLGQTLQVRRILSRFAGVVSLEVFSFSHLSPSLACLEKIWQDCILGQNSL